VDLISRYEVKLVEPGCSPGSGRFGGLVSLPADISPVFPYLNAALNSTFYDHHNSILIIREAKQSYAFRPHEISIARAEDYASARQAAAEIIERVNKIWQERDSITPRLTEKKHVSVIDVFKLLPKTNCRRCGYLTCLAYAADLRQGKSRLDDCPPLNQPGQSETRQKVADLFEGE